MDFSTIKVPFLKNIEIESVAENFREKYTNNSIPINVEKIIEFELDIEIIPIPELGNNCDTDALITSNWKFIYVDNSKYLDDKYQNRLRFSLAHEIGHFILHKEIYKSFSIKSLEDFYSFIGDVPGSEYEYLEIQANKFANYLLIPRGVLKKEKDKLLKKNSELDDIDSETVNSYIAGPLSSVFGVSAQVAEIALNDLKLI